MRADFEKWQVCCRWTSSAQAQETEEEEGCRGPIRRLNGRRACGRRWCSQGHGHKEEGEALAPQPLLTTCLPELSAWLLVLFGTLLSGAEGSDWLAEPDETGKGKKSESGLSPVLKCPVTSHTAKRPFCASPSNNQHACCITLGHHGVE